MTSTLIVLALAVSSVLGTPASLFPDREVPAKIKDKVMKDLEDAQMLKELEFLVKNLDDEQLKSLEAIMGKDLDETTEFDMIMQELKEMGMSEDDIEDLQTISEMMYEFLVLVPDMEKKLELDDDYDLLDNIQLYLLGLPNKLGPLGYIALHHVLEGEENHAEIVDVQYAKSSAGEAKDLVHHHSHTSKDSMEMKETAPKFRRRRSAFQVNNN